MKAYKLLLAFIEPKKILNLIQNRKISIATILESARRPLVIQCHAFSVPATPLGDCPPFGKLLCHASGILKCHGSGIWCHAFGIWCHAFESSRQLQRNSLWTFLWMYEELRNNSFTFILRISASFCDRLLIFTSNLMKLFIVEKHSRIFLPLVFSFLEMTEYWTLASLPTNKNFRLVTNVWLSFLNNKY